MTKGERLSKKVDIESTNNERNIKKYSQKKNNSHQEAGCWHGT
jgi:hypothetical protein